MKKILFLILVCLSLSARAQTTGSVYSVTGTSNFVYNFLHSTNNVIYDTNQISISFTWAGPTNSVPVDNGYHFYSTAGNFSFTNMSAVPGSNLWSTIVVSNSLGINATGYVSFPGLRLYAGSNAPVIPSGKTCVFSFLSQSTYLTNGQNAVQSN